MISKTKVTYIDGNKCLNMAKRPLLISIIGYIYLLMGLTMLFVGMAAIFGLSITVPGLLVVGGPIGAGLLVTGLILFVIAYGFLNGWSIMWYLGVIISALMALSSLLALPAGMVTLVINAVILYYLFRPGVKKFFKI